MPRVKKDNDIPEALAEQLVLREVEKEILILIEKINVKLNQLVVEELQFKSNQITSELLVTDEIDTKTTNVEIVATFDSEFVNQQLLDETLLNCTNNEMEEVDDESSLMMNRC